MTDHDDLGLIRLQWDHTEKERESVTTCARVHSGDTTTTDADDGLGEKPPA